MKAIIDFTHSYYKSYSIFNKTQPNADLSQSKYKGILIRKAITDICSTLNKIHPVCTGAYFCFDGTSWREGVSSEYKASRNAKEYGFYECIDIIKRILFENGYKVFYGADAESDDMIALVCQILESQPKMIISADEDMHQLIDQSTVVYNNNGKHPKVFVHKDSKGLFLNTQYSRVEIDPNFIKFKKILLGCPTDQVSPLISKRGIGEKTIEKIFNRQDFEFNAEYIEKSSSKILKFEREDFNQKYKENYKLVVLGDDDVFPPKVIKQFLDSYDKNTENKSSKYSAGELLKGSEYWTE